ncbi:hypothetical protein [Bradyrhizobium sp. 33ap4]|uniref:hypothetical protein n=1 Tax=Bradyrhizobium sp. 33ap4 TaxID=3061630 RepID=UPI00292DC0C0|nr:hypothetical protein [Bradyrhizobium sp. 33ap4]
MIIIVGMYEWDPEKPPSRRRSSAPHDQHGAAARRHVDDDRPRHHYLQHYQQRHQHERQYHPRIAINAVGSADGPAVADHSCDRSEIAYRTHGEISAALMFGFEIFCRFEMIWQ